jgi:hypothetical protein
VTVAKSLKGEGREEALVSILVVAKPTLACGIECNDDAFEEIRNLLSDLASGGQIATRIGMGDPRLTVLGDDFVVLCRRVPPKDDPRATRQPAIFEPAMVTQRAFTLKDGFRRLRSTHVRA